MKKYIHIYIVTFLSLVLLIKCSTEKDAWLNKTYHNTTAHYNGYWNAREIIKETNKNFELNYLEDYDKIIPVFIYPNEEESKAFKSPMDTAIKKCELVIFKHQMPNKKAGQYKKTEWCVWIDDNWFAIAESQFYKRELGKSYKRFEFISKQYPTQPIIFDAKLWMAKVHMENENMPAAKSILDELLEKYEDQVESDKSKKLKQEKTDNKKKTPKRKGQKKRKPAKKKPTKTTVENTAPAKIPESFLSHYYPVLADYHLRKKEYIEAKDALEKSIELVSDRQFKTRLIFILAQLNHKMSNPEASDLYAEVVKRNPKYDMAFMAKINKALAYSGGDKKGIKSELKKMLKDEKNVDYLDQIYYALADIELSENNKDLGITYLEKSVMSSTSNQVQKSKSFLRLGKLFYANKSYIKAQKYYDSTLTSLSKEHPEYATIEYQNISLTELVNNLNQADRQDSLLNLCSLSANELEKKIFGLIDEEIALKEEQKRNAANSALLPVAATDLAAKGDFWAFNPKVRDNGFTKFKEVWGPRINEDDWRRSDKSASFFSESEEEATEVKEKDPKLTVDYYKKDLPCGNSKLEAKATTDIIEGYYNAATIYKQKLKDLDAAFTTFQKLETHLPHQKAVESLYQSYLINQTNNNASNTSKYKDWILRDYPDSEYGKILKNPNYLNELSQASKKEEVFYEAIYNDFISRNYEKVITEIDKRIQLKDNPYLCKYYYMKALSIGYSKPDPNNLAAVEKALEDVLNNCDDEIVLNQTNATLDKLKNRQSVIDASSGASTYIYATDSKHYFVLVFPNDAGSVNQARSKVSDLNMASFSNKNLEVKSSFIDENNQIITVKTFSDKDDAMDYYLTFKTNNNQVKKLQEFDYFVITDKNFSSLFLEKDIPQYLEFFKKNYKK